MAMSDPIADMLTRIRNAGKAKFASVDVPGSKLKEALARVMQRQGYIRNFKVIEDDKQGVIRIYLKYDQDQQHVIWGLKRVSKPSRRMYVKAKDIKPVMNGLGVSVLSTSNGILTDKEARQANIGGEVICNIW
ncbi:MAG: 30S ribosomal protein S8 [Deltaproteobacteria bacterium]|nr:MAG: 30S ribosomal protein S8 [Deltaproteobacteria bacterium]